MTAATIKPSHIDETPSKPIARALESVNFNAASVTKSKAAIKDDLVKPDKKPTETVTITLSKPAEAKKQRTLANFERKYVGDLENIKSDADGMLGYSLYL